MVALCELVVRGWGRLPLLMLLGVSACSTSSDRLATVVPGEGNGLVFFRTVSSPGIPGQKQSGFMIAFRNLDTGRTFKSVKGIWGFPGQTDYGMWLPPGRYELSEVFIANGSVRPKLDGFRFQVVAGEYVYLGTLATSHHFPETGYNSRSISSLKIYFRNDCHFIWGCEEVRAEVYVLHDTFEAAGLLENLQADSGKSIAVRLMR